MALRHTKRFFAPDTWTVTESSYQPEHNRFFETIFFLGNGYMGVRGVPEEGVEAKDSNPFTFVGSVYDTFEVRAWRTKISGGISMVTAPNWFPISFYVENETFDPHTGKVSEYSRILDMARGTVSRTLIWESPLGKKVKVQSTRFVSMNNIHQGAIRFSITPLDFSGKIRISSAIDATGCERLVPKKLAGEGENTVCCSMQTTQTGFDLVTLMHSTLTASNSTAPLHSALKISERSVSTDFVFTAKQNCTYTLDKLVSVCTSRDSGSGSAYQRAARELKSMVRCGFDALLEEHVLAWASLWERNDICIDGDASSQQGIRLSIMNMHQNYAGYDPLVNMAAKGLSGPGYGGLYWWDSEMYMLPYFLYNNPDKAKKLVEYRAATIDGARKKAAWMGYRGAMFPWVTIDGEERSGDWEYGLCEQHVTAAMAYAVKHYVEGTGDQEFLFSGGAAVVIETARFWASRVYADPRKKKYTIIGVTGPDEYAINVNNNCYTNAMAKFNIEYALTLVALLSKKNKQEWETLSGNLGVKAAEITLWKHIVKNMYIPFDVRLGIHIQDDAFLDRQEIDLTEVPASEHPLQSHWNWEKLMRHQAIKQSDVVLMDYALGDRIPTKTKKADFDFYEPRTTHDSSLSPCTHSIIAAELGYGEKAFEYYRRTARLDLDDVNGNADEGFHIACMAGSWMSIVNGFAGMRTWNGKLSFNPALPKKWKKLAFKIFFRNRQVAVELKPNSGTFTLTSGETLQCTIKGVSYTLTKSPLVVKM